MKLISYNVNGIRAAIKKGFFDWLETSKADVICLQETKALRSQLTNEDLHRLQKLGYHDYWFSAQKKGYSGVAIFCKKKPLHIEYGTGIDYMDFEGRTIRVDFEDVSVISLYLPSGSNLDRLEFKLQFCADFLNYIKELKKDLPNLIVSGDYNICHQAIDIHNPISNKNSSGFLPVEREWLSDFMKETGLFDSFRQINSEAHMYSWWSYRANSRANNKGWRIDYNMISEPLLSRLQSVQILSTVKHSDHCPVSLDLD